MSFQTKLQKDFLFKKLSFTLDLPKKIRKYDDIFR